MEGYDYDFQRVIDAEKAEETVKKVPASPDSKKPPYGKMFAAVVVHTVAVGLVSVLFGAVTLAVTGKELDTSSPFVRVGLAALDVFYWALYVLIPFLFAKSTYRTPKPRLVFMGCFYVQGALTSAVESVTVKILGIAQKNLSAPDPQMSTVVSSGVFSGLSTVVTIVIQLVFLFLVVKRASENGLFDEKTSVRETLLMKETPKMPMMAAVCAALMCLFSTGTGLLVERFHTEEAGTRNVLLSVLSGAVCIGMVALCYVVGKRICQRPDGALLFTGLVTGAWAVSFGKVVVDLIYAVASVLGGASVPSFADTAVTVVSVAVGAVTAAWIAYFVLQRLEAPAKHKSA